MSSPCQHSATGCPKRPRRRSGKGRRLPVASSGHTIQYGVSGLLAATPNRECANESAERESTPHSRALSSTLSDLDGCPPLPPPLAEPAHHGPTILSNVLSKAHRWGINLSDAQMRLSSAPEGGRQGGKTEYKTWAAASRRNKGRVATTVRPDRFHAVSRGKSTQKEPSCWDGGSLTPL